MTQGQYNKSDYDIVSISQVGKEKRATTVRLANYIERSRISSNNQFVRVFADMFLTKESRTKAVR
ncbi:hypothetical protein A2291_00465 [candidate division WOR-1 bacterium RIFOXYB2_FULL_42_35]|uniref:Uncharacterized protein n=1 Tax=candidate division WOR-1 bacterium RIFOXYC2_FULL_41_25 TaxID=1802586 RepID=A0A1F4TP98_UNCSA|nr:MAG: hypothetical protein A2247_08030 [candidate division WOR-1 bacterium RIFOXYA2_FULL_41_14]OGC23706.1 MAG: hypothetical protein A2291_00465 [candidate division WOR-1 bacterium RIFOXYB2_FULL_42_35]OGC34419.1 MAG: hypothetical protein A2462_01230 [candidate division WOR-1 bacterium RIFOXYC2_FULL_41_25]OGC43268.1 MAG: hypothetical protein A2548_01575 [candidate division WOR-1 bacterium RIFOXYD2_FULL_41_8]